MSTLSKPFRTPVLRIVVPGFEVWMVNSNDPGRETRISLLRSDGWRSLAEAMKVALGLLWVTIGGLIVSGRDKKLK